MYISFHQVEFATRMVLTRVVIVKFDVEAINDEQMFAHQAVFVNIYNTSKRFRSINTRFHGSKEKLCGRNTVPGENALKVVVICSTPRPSKYAILRAGERRSVITQINWSEIKFYSRGKLIRK